MRPPTPSLRGLLCQLVDRIEGLVIRALARKPERP